MRINHEFLGSALIEVNITLWSIVQRYHSHVDRLGDMDFVVEDRLHELAIVFQDRRLSGLEGVAFGPAEPYSPTADLAISLANTILEVELLD